MISLVGITHKRINCERHVKRAVKNPLIVLIECIQNTVSYAQGVIYSEGFIRTPVTSTPGVELTKHPEGCYMIDTTTSHTWLLVGTQCWCPTLSIYKKDTTMFWRRKKKKGGRTVKPITQYKYIVTRVSILRNHT